MVKVMLTYKVGAGGLPVVGGGGSLMTNSAGSVTTQMVSNMSRFPESAKVQYT
jgi:hypothetical protein